MNKGCITLCGILSFASEFCFIFKNNFLKFLKTLNDFSWFIINFNN